MKLRRGLDDVLHARRIVDAGKLDDDAIAALRRDERLGDAEGVDAVADGLDGVLDGVLVAVAVSEDFGVGDWVGVALGVSVATAVRVGVPVGVAVNDAVLFDELGLTEIERELVKIDPGYRAVSPTAATT